MEQGPKRDRLTAIGARLDEAVEDVWNVAQQGHELSKGRNRIDIDGTRERLSAVTGDDSTASATREALQSQLDAAERLNLGVSGAERQLRLLQARMDEAVAKAAEVTAGSSDVGVLDADMTHLVDDLEALRQAMVEADDADGLEALADWDESGGALGSTG